MYEKFFGLAEKPFSLTPNPKYIFYSEHYRNALDQLMYGLEEREGFMLLTGMVGTGKTTLTRELLENLDPKRYRTALIFNPFLSGAELLETLLTEFGCTYPQGANRKELLDRLYRFLLSQVVEGRTCVAVFDEAQHLSEEFLEQIRVLSNLETEHEKLLQIVLVGQPELLKKISNPSLAQLDQRVSLRCMLRDLTREEAEQYIYHRLNMAGAQGRIRFHRKALGQIHQESHGVPRLINLISDRTLLAAYVDRVWAIKPHQVAQGMKSLRGEFAMPKEPPGITQRWSRSRWRIAIPFAVVVLFLAIGAAAWYTGLIP